MQSNERRSYRVSVLYPPQKGVLRSGKRPMPVRLLDESAGGFAVLADLEAKMSKGDIAVLQIDRTRYEVRVVHVGRYTVPPDSSAAPLQSGGRYPALRIGLERLRELDPLEIRGGEFLGRKRWWSRNCVGPRSSRPLVAAILAILIVALPLAAAVWKLGSNRSWLK